MIVYLLTEEQKDRLVGNLFTYNSYFNPIQDVNDNWIISIEEVEQCTMSEFIWVKNLPTIEYIPKEVTDIF